MGIFEICLLALVLSIDATVVSFSQGLVFKNQKRKNSLILAFFLGFFQFLMPLVGYYTSLAFYIELQFIGKWLIFGIFLLLGAKFIAEAFSKTPKKEVQNLSIIQLLFFAVATSIDAMGAGVALCLSDANIWASAVLIGIITFINSLLGFWGGYLFKEFPTKYLQICGGIILIALGINALF